VAKLRGILRERRVGHAGTLDPMATGVLTVFLGAATRACEFATADDKEYVFRFRTGFETDTQDITGAVTARSGEKTTPQQVAAALCRFTGPIGQTPPMYSAVMKDGVRLYKLARQGIEVKREARLVTIKSLELLGSEPAGEEYELRAVCTKGTYVRTLCEDLGRTLGCMATMTYLRRTRAGRFDLRQAHTLKAIENLAAKGAADELVLPVETLFSDLPAVTVDAHRKRALLNGAPIEPFIDSGVRGRVRVRGEDGAFLMLGQMTGDGAHMTLGRIKNFFDGESNG